MSFTFSLSTRYCFILTTTNPDTIILTWKKTDSNKVMVVILLIYLYNEGTDFLEMTLEEKKYVWR